MRGLLVAAAVCVAALVVVLMSAPAGADTFTDTWLRGASSVALNDDATALFLNPAGLGMYDDSNSYMALSMSGEDVLALQGAVDDVKLDQSLIDYIIALVEATRENDELQVGVSPRGSLAISQAARATALVHGRDYCVPEDIVSNVLPVCAHRVISKTYMHAGDTATTRRIIQQVLETVPSPV